MWMGFDSFLFNRYGKNRLIKDVYVFTEQKCKTYAFVGHE